MEPMSFIAGFASGWLVRSSVNSARGLAVGAIAAYYGLSERTRQWFATEREYFEDLLAEGRSRAEAERLRKAPRPRAASRAANSVGRERAA